MVPDARLEWDKVLALEEGPLRWGAEGSARRGHSAQGCLCPRLALALASWVSMLLKVKRPVGGRDVCFSRVDVAGPVWASLEHSSCVLQHLELCFSSFFQSFPGLAWFRWLDCLLGRRSKKILALVCLRGIGTCCAQGLGFTQNVLWERIHFIFIVQPPNAESLESPHPTTWQLWSQRQLGTLGLRVSLGSCR